MKLDSIKILVLFLLAVWTKPVSAQQLRTSYFMDKSIARLAMNPAFRPERGYVLIPGIGSLGTSYTSNGLSLDDVLFTRGDKLVTFLDGSVDADDFLKRVRRNNQFNFDVATNLLSAGWFAGRGFWTADISVKGVTTLRAPKSLFEFMKKGNGESGQVYHIRDVNIYADSYLEAAVGYSRPVNKRLVVGGKLKFLTGIANIDASIDHLRAELFEDRWKITSSGRMNATMKGLSPTFGLDSRDQEYIDDFDFDTPGAGGFGVAVDLGATYRLLPELTVSAALIDFGFIRWSGARTVSGRASGEFDFDGFDLAIGDNQHDTPSMSDQFEQRKDELNELFHFRETAASGRTRMLRATLNLGAEYSIFSNTLGFGLLSSTRFYYPKAATELTASVNYRPLDWVSASLSYSFVHSDFKTFGWALNFSPSFIHFFMGSDFMFTKVTPQFVPVSAHAMSAYVGIGIPLGRSRYSGCNRF